MEYISKQAKIRGLLFHLDQSKGQDFAETITFSWSFFYGALNVSGFLFPCNFNASAFSGQH